MKKLLIMTCIAFMALLGTTLNSLAEEKPQYGGIVKEIFAGGPQVLGYYPEMGPGDHAAAFPALESKVRCNTLIFAIYSSFTTALGKISISLLQACCCMMGSLVAFCI